jgi:hypothetical protein
MMLNLCMPYGPCAPASHGKNLNKIGKLRTNHGKMLKRITMTGDPLHI